jgi:hypothetical protein
MTRIYESRPVLGNFVCPIPHGAAEGLAGRPFSACGDCAFMSHMNCVAGSVVGSVNAQENFAQNAKKALHFF